MLEYCTRCVMPSSKPDLIIDSDGICNACSAYQNRERIDWEKRAKNFNEIIRQYQNPQSAWDCIVPVSGGKDSTYQVVRMLQLGLNPLCVTATTCDLSVIGRKNIENIKSLGVDYIEFSPNKIVRRKLNRIGLTEVGDISWPEHVSIFTIPVRIALQFKVPLIVWGENPQNEYGGPASESNNNVLTRRWLEEFGGLLGMRVADIPLTSNIDKKHLFPYMYPSDEELNAVGVTGLYLGYYFPWDGLSNALIAQANGFQTFEKVVEGSMVNYENVDNHQTGIHDYFKYLKFGFSRATDIACLHVRRGRITRTDALDIVKKHDGQFPWTYLNKPINEILEPLDMTVSEFIEICDQFTNKSIFRKNADGSLYKDKNGNLQKINDDNIIFKKSIHNKSL